MDRRSLNKNKKPSPSSWPQKEAGVTSLKKRMRAKNKKSAQMYMKIKPTAVLPFLLPAVLGPFYIQLDLFPRRQVLFAKTQFPNAINSCNQIIQ